MDPPGSGRSSARGSGWGASARSAGSRGTSDASYRDEGSAASSREASSASWWGDDDSAQSSRAESKSADRETAPPVTAAELAALQEHFGLGWRELRVLSAEFKRLDKDASGTVDRRELFEWLREPFTAFSNAIFDLVKAESQGDLRFPELVRAICTFCLLSRDEVLKFCFFVFDKNRNGFLDSLELHQLVNYLHGQTQEAPLLDVDAMLRDYDADSDGRISFAEFQTLNARHPFILYPAFRLQAQVQRKTLGRGWWRLQRSMLARRHTARLRKAGGGSLLSPFQQWVDRAIETSAVARQNSRSLLRLVTHGR